MGMDFLTVLQVVLAGELVVQSKEEFEVFRGLEELYHLLFGSVYQLVVL